MSKPLIITPGDCLAPGWWDYGALRRDPRCERAARLTAEDLLALSRAGFRVRIYDTPQEFYAAEATEYVEAWRQSTPDAPVGICGPIGPTEQLSLVALFVNQLGLNLRALGAHFWGMDEWAIDGQAVGPDHPLSFYATDRALCFDRIDPALVMPATNLHFPGIDPDYPATYDSVRCAIMQGGQGWVKHWAFNDPLPRTGDWVNEPPPPEVFLALGTRCVDLHPMTMMQNAATSGGGNFSIVPTQAYTVGPVETWKADCVSIWHAGMHDNPFGIRLTALMISEGIACSAVPMSLLARHPNVRFNYLRSGIGTCNIEMH